MKHVFHAFLLTSLLVVLFGLPLVASAAQPIDQATDRLPANLSAAEWAQVQSLLPDPPNSQQAYIKASNTGSDQFGFSVALSGDTLAVGTPYEASNATGINGNETDNSASNAGAVYVFTRSGTTWSQQAYIKASNTEEFDQFGFSVALSGDTLAVGARYEDSNATGINGDQANNSALDSGAVYVFTRSGTTWSQQAYIKASNAEAGDTFSEPSIALAGDTLAVGVPGEDSNATGIDGDQMDNSANGAGAVYVFTRSGTTWSQQAYIKASNTETSDRFGNSVVLSGDTLAVGTPYESSNATGINGNQIDNSASGAGAVYIFTRNGTTWSQQAYIKASNAEAADSFAWAIALSGDTLTVGAPGEDSNAIGIDGNQANNSANGSGAVYIFTRSGITWNQQAYIKASNADTKDGGDSFGLTVALSTDILAVGTWREDSNATGIDGNQTDNSADNSGAAYIFTRSGTSWSQQHYIKASNAESHDLFADVITLSGDTLAVGARMEDSNATSVNGNQADNSTNDAGAVYVFVAVAPTATPTATPTRTSTPTSTPTPTQVASTLTLKSIPVEDGWVLESTETSGVGGTMDNAATTFRLGDEVADKQYRSILSFNTALLPDTAVIQSATLKIKQNGAPVGSDPFTILGSVWADIRTGTFGAGALELVDFNSTASVNAAGAFNSTPVSGFYTLTMNATARNALNKLGRTQFRLRFGMDDNNDAAADYMKFLSGDFTSSQPELTITYIIP